ncbi:VWA domain-containing protein [bacterium]|nr:VWA domain-containing protein [bacterium]
MVNISSSRNKKAFGRLTRDKAGLTMVVMMAVIALLILPVLGIFSFEVGRAMLAQEQLKHVCDAAALTAAASLASQDDSNPANSHAMAISAAVKLIKKNTIFGDSLTNTSVVSSFSGTLPVGDTEMIFIFQDPISRSIVPQGDPRGKVVKVKGHYGLLPAFGKFLGTGSYDVTAVSSSSVPKLDVILCFDVSGSIDDQTPVSCVRRKWSPAASKIVYDIPAGTAGPAAGKIYDIINPAPTGSNLNGLEPQTLDKAYFNAGLNFSEYLASYYGTPGLRSLGGYPEVGRPPGNYPPGTAPTFDGFRAFTDVVVNIDGNRNFGGFTYKGYSFPDIATLVEASRGNLENGSVFASSKADTSVSVAPRTGYQAAYLEAARLRLQPLNDAKQAAKEFVEILNIDTESHFGFVAFDAFVGSAPDSTWNWINLDQDVPYGENKAYPLPRVMLSDSSGDSRFAEVKTSIEKCVPLGATNIGLPLHEAVQNLKNKGRIGTAKAIVLFTDGQPTPPGGPLDSDPAVNARLAAVEARDAGIPVYTVGLATNPAIAVGQREILNDSNSNVSSGGIAGIAGHGGTFQQVDDSAELRRAFARIARHLTRLTTSF